MAVKEFRPAKRKVRIKYKKTYLGLFVAFVVLSVFCVGYRINAKAQIAEYKAQIAQIEEKTEKLSAENDDYASVLSSTDKRDYYEKIAREVYGYAKPGEYVFYKTAS